MPDDLKILIADDHPLFRGALRQALGGISAEADIIEAGDFDQAKAFLLDTPDLDLVLLDLRMPGASGLSGLVSLRGIVPNVPIIVVTASDDSETVRRSLELGASGFISKSSSLDDIRSGIKAVLAGDILFPDHMELGSEGDPEISELIGRLRALTPQQTRVLSMLAEGLLNKQIAYELGVSEATIKAHVSAVLQKLGVDSRTQAVIQLTKIGLDTGIPVE
ncbi:MAG: response regulator transcription factor [Rhizobiaceae bacterium]